MEINREACSTLKDKNRNLNTVVFNYSDDICKLHDALCSYDEQE